MDASYLLFYEPREYHNFTCDGLFFRFVFKQDNVEVIIWD